MTAVIGLILERSWGLVHVLKELPNEFGGIANPTSQEFFEMESRVSWSLMHA